MKDCFLKNHLLFKILIGPLTVEIFYYSFYVVWQFDLQAYDQHLNMILGDVEEIVTTVEIDDETYEEIVRVC